LKKRDEQVFSEHGSISLTIVHGRYDEPLRRALWSMAKANVDVGALD
jgi:hypothetical protein